ncbi:hypothetical protein CLOSTMETH_00123 [[Clostridium] methylpentosum DSM 5476]|uniref:Uncharacterized protein n=1 Tax=[Clostridium] methylpentosum DSM 5476 TaxID=537013 RepID=C0E8H8_9FIRM|nr:hypothetical protein CLOSTMETH_00123 [[Clostridium] methylpentosum DSM 5476]
MRSPNPQLFLQKKVFFYLKIFIFTSIAGGFISLKQTMKNPWQRPTLPEILIVMKFF